MSLTSHQCQMTKADVSWVAATQIGVLDDCTASLGTIPVTWSKAEGEQKYGL